MTLRIVNVITRMIVGGPQQVSLLAAGYYRELGSVEYHLVFGPGSGPEGDYHEEVASAGIPYHVIPEVVREVAPLSDLRAVAALVRLFRRLQPHIVHARSAKARFVAPLAARLVGTPIVVQTVHGWSFNNAVDKRRLLFKQLEKIASSLCQCTVLVSEKDLAEGAELGIIPKDAVARGSVAIIRSGVDLSEMKPLDEYERARFRQSLGVSGNRPVISLVQRLSEPKTPLVFVAALREVISQRPDVCFLIVGDGPLRSETERAVGELDLTNHVQFLGLRKDITAILSASDVVVHSSIREGLPRVVLEALAIGTPIVATNVGGVPEAVRDGINGLLVPPQDPAALGRALLASVSQPAAAAARAQAGRTSVDSFSARKMLNDQHALYTRLLARGGVTMSEATTGRMLP
jgi:glycosyltransferase involved in cell wall biosynthesis